LKKNVFNARRIGLLKIAPVTTKLSTLSKSGNDTRRLVIEACAQCVQVSASIYNQSLSLSKDSYSIRCANISSIRSNRGATSSYIINQPASTEPYQNLILDILVPIGKRAHKRFLVRTFLFQPFTSCTDGFFACTSRFFTTTSITCLS
jgi:hypothetical protein